MVEHRRPRAAGSSRGGAGRRPSRAPQSSGPSPASILLIVIPVVGILALGGFMVFRKKPEAAPIVHDENAAMKELIAQIDALERDQRAAIKAGKDESHGARQEAEKFRDAAQDWVIKWDEVTKPLKIDDELGSPCRPEYQGYAEYRRRVNVLLNDFIKMTNF